MTDLCGLPNPMAAPTVTTDDEISPRSEVNSVADEDERIEAAPRRRRNWDYQLNSTEPRQLTWKGVFGITPHWRCLILSTLLGVCFAVLIWCKVPYLSDGVARVPCREGLIWIPATVALLFYLLYLVECMHCNIHQDLRRVLPASAANDLIDGWMAAKPLIRWRAVCYHYGRGIRQGCLANDNPANGSVQHLPFVRVNSHTAEGRYRPYDCGHTDRSTPVKHLDQYHITKVDIDKYFSFGCTCSEAAYVGQRKAFYENNVAADDYIEVHETFHLSATDVPDGLCVSRSDSLPWVFTRPVFWLLSLVCLSWPLRIYMERKTAYAHLTVHKQFGARCNGVLATSGHSLSSYGSKLSDNQYGVIPSYSQALLMSSYTLNGTRIPASIQDLQLYNTAAEHKNCTTARSNHQLYNASRKNSSQRVSASKTADSLYRVCSVRQTFRRSSSVNSPGRRPAGNTNDCQLSSPASLLPELVVNGESYTPMQAIVTTLPPPQQPPPSATNATERKLSRSKTSANVIQALRKALPRSRTLDERSLLL